MAKTTNWGIAMPEEMVACRTPAKGRDGVTNIPKWKYDAVHVAILKVVDAAGPEGAQFSKLADQVRRKLSDDELARLGSVAWHSTTVKLNMEVTGEIERINGVKLQRVRRG